MTRTSSSSNQKPESSDRVGSPETLLVVDSVSTWKTPIPGVRLTAARDYDVVYLGYNGDGHFRRFNLSLSGYAALGDETRAGEILNQVPGASWKEFVDAYTAEKARASSRN